MVGKYSVKNLLAHLRSGGSFTQPQHILRSVVSLRVGHQPLLFSLDDLCVIHAVFTSLLSRDLMYGWWTTFDIQLLMIPHFRILFWRKKDLFSNYNYNFVRGCFRRVRDDVLAFKNKQSVLSAKWLRKKYNKGCNHGWKILC